MLLDCLQHALPLQSLILLFKWGGRSWRTRVGRSLERVRPSLLISANLVVVELHPSQRSRRVRSEATGTRSTRISSVRLLFPASSSHAHAKPVIEYTTRRGRDVALACRRSHRLGER